VILIGLGANLPTAEGMQPAATLRCAAGAIAALPKLRPVALSGLWDSAPVPASDQPRYVNAVLALAGRVDPESLLAALHAIEARFGRRRAEPNAARTLDLDLLDHDGLVRHGPVPLLPHPRIAGRGFVLLPLAEVAPCWRHPVTGESVAAMIAALPPAERAACRPIACRPIACRPIAGGRPAVAADRAP
jgi:2-amino-4-hydroxy-6-hydroxymethyldihydropteridine diphosphokinase